MKFKTFLAEFESKKTQHPEGSKKLSIVVIAQMKKDALQDALTELVFWDSENAHLYKKPKLTEIEGDEADARKLEYLADKERFSQNSLPLEDSTLVEEKHTSETKSVVNPQPKMTGTQTAKITINANLSLFIRIAFIDNRYSSSFAIHSHDEISKAANSVIKGDLDNYHLSTYSLYSDAIEYILSAASAVIVSIAENLESGSRLHEADEVFTVSKMLWDKVGKDAEDFFNSHIVNDETFHTPTQVTEKTHNDTQKNNETQNDTVSSISEQKEPEKHEEPQITLDTLLDVKPDVEEKTISKTEKQIIEINERLDGLALGESFFIDDLPNDVYHGCNGDSSTKLKDACQSLMYYNGRYNTGDIEKPIGAHFDVGNLAHALILQPELVEKEFKQKPDMKEPTLPQRVKYDEWVKAGKPSKEKDKKLYPTEIALERCEFWDNFLEDNNDVTIVDKDNWKIAEAMAKAVHENQMAKAMLDWPDRKSERSYFKRDEETGRVIKIRTDIDCGAIIGDLKTIQLRSRPDEDRLLEKLDYEIRNRKYDLSAAMYLDVKQASQFIWIFVNKEPGYHWVAVIRASEKTIERGRQLYRSKLNAIQNAEEIGDWPAPNSIQHFYDKTTSRFEIPTI